MKKILIIITITILSVSTIVLGIGTIHFYNESNNAKDKISDLEKQNKDLKDEIEENQNTSYQVKNDNSNNEEPNTEKSEPSSDQTSYSNLETITLSDYISLINEKKSFILLTSQTFCSHCTNFKPVLNKVLDNHNLKAYIIEYNLLSNEEKATFNSVTKISATPTTIFIKNGVEENESKRLNGEVSEKDIEARLKELGYIK